MSIANHPAGKARTCTTTGCDQPGAALVAVATSHGVAGLGFAIVRPATSPEQRGQLLCLDCAHTSIDVMLLRATPAPVETQEPGR